MQSRHSSWQVRVLDVAEEQIKQLAKNHAGQRQHLVALLNELKESPDQKGKPLRGTLAGFRRISRGRFRVIYKVFDSRLVVVAVAAGWREEGARKDAYNEISHLIKSGALDLTSIAPDTGSPPLD